MVVISFFVYNQTVFFDKLETAYVNYTINAIREIGNNIDITYGLKGKVAKWKDMPGGAEQIVTPLNGEMMKKLGIMKK